MLFSIVIYGIVFSQSKPIIAWFGVPILFVIIICCAYETSRYINIISIDCNRIKVRTPFYKVNEFQWHEIKNIYVYQFDGTDNIEIACRKSGKTKSYGKIYIPSGDIYVPRNVPKKWIYIDNGKGGNGENLFPYFAPLKKWGKIRLPHKKGIISFLEKKYPKEIILMSEALL